jgi:hemerythrin HHE cation binding domain-containing protein
VCEYCGCQALATISELTREHELAAGLASRARAALAKAGVPLMTDLARQIAAILAPHTAVEEDGLFPALAADFPAHIAALQTEHQHIEAVLGQALAGTPAGPAWPSRLTETLQLLREHILKEQDGVFPAALASLGTADRAAAEAVRARVGSLLPGAGGWPAAPPRTSRPQDSGDPVQADISRPDGQRLTSPGDSRRKTGRPITGRERRGQEGQQGEAGLALVSHTQLLIAPVEGKRPGSEGNRAIVGIERPFAFDREDHEIRRTVGMRGEDLARAEPDETDIGLRALKERLSHHLAAVAARSIAEADDVHHRSIARCEPGRYRWSGRAA